MAYVEGHSAIIVFLLLLLMLLSLMLLVLLGFVLVHILFFRPTGSHLSDFLLGKITWLI